MDPTIHPPPGSKDPYHTLLCQWEVAGCPWGLASPFFLSGFLGPTGIVVCWESVVTKPPLRTFGINHPSDDCPTSPLARDTFVSNCD